MALNMSEWKEIELSDIIDFGNGKKKPNSDGDIPIYGGNGILGYSGESNYEDETIIIGRVGAYCGSVYYENKPIWVSDNALAAKAKVGNSTKFLYYFLKKANLNQYAGGSSHPLVTQTLLNSLEYEICVDEIEQKAIASVLSSIDDKIDLLHRQNETLEQLAETLFRQWFIKEADAEWEWRELDEFIEVQRGLSYNGAGLTDSEGGIPMHNLNSIYEGGGYKETGIKYYNGEFKERHKVFPGDIIITNTEQGHEHLLIGYPAIVPRSFGDYGIFSQHIYRLEIKSSFSNFFLFHLLKTHDVHEQIAGATNGSTVNMLSKDGVEWVKFRMPPQKLIEDFTKIVNDYYKKQELNQSQIRTLASLRDILLPKLMSGEVRVKS
jgi:type I restriction enzyme S subunit